MLLKFDHPNIIRSLQYEYDESELKHYIYGEFYNGGSVADLMEFTEIIEGEE